MADTPDLDAAGTPWTAYPYVVVDVEGNGQRPPDLVEVAVVPVVGGTVGAATAWLIRPPRPITWQARRVHGLTDADLADAPTIEDLRDEIAGRLGSAIVVGHNVGVDLAVLGRCLPGWHPGPVIDTLRLARRLLPDLPSHRLGALVDHFGLATSLPAGGPHRAAYDALAAAHLFTRLAEHDATRPRSLAELLDRAMPGKGATRTRAQHQADSQLF
jgi:DNA polymerase III epsilon subunit-like protein